MIQLQYTYTCGTCTTDIYTCTWSDTYIHVHEASHVYNICIQISFKCFNIRIVYVYDSYMSPSSTHTEHPPINGDFLSDFGTQHPLRTVVGVMRVEVQITRT